MPIEDRLVQGEHVIATYRDFYATDRRLMRCRKGWTGEKVESLLYNRITSLTLASAFRKDLIVMGVILLSVSICLKLSMWLMESLMGPLKQWMPFNLAAISAVLDPVLLLLALAGIACSGAGIILRGTWYQIKAPGLTDKDLKKWRIPCRGAMQVEGFVRKVEERLFKAEGKSS